MKYKELVRRLNIEKYNKAPLVGRADEKDIDIHIKGSEDEHKFCIVEVNDVQFKFRGITLGMQEASDDAWLLFTGNFNEKAIRISNIRTIVFNYNGWEYIHG